MTQRRRRTSVKGSVVVSLLLPTCSGGQHSTGRKTLAGKQGAVAETVIRSIDIPVICEGNAILSTLMCCTSRANLSCNTLLGHDDSLDVVNGWVGGLLVKAVGEVIDIPTPSEKNRLVVSAMVCTHQHLALQTIIEGLLELVKCLCVTPVTTIRDSDVLNVSVESGESLICYCCTHLYLLR
jgi:hypothetical protein